ncbi:anthranilate phosphoribosyltransferase, partial [bacterium]|nr:anthranilate phosphoribosyltransferase [bacterium]
MLREAIEKISDGEILTRDEARQALEYIFDEKASPVQTSAFLMALRTRGETSVELAGMLDAMKARMKTVACANTKAVDVCGTGGDGSGSFNISTAAGLTAA